VTSTKTSNPMFVGEPDWSQGGEVAPGLVNPVDTGFVRPVDLSLAPDDMFFAIQLHLSSEVMLTLCGNAPGKLGPPPHSHGMDQFFYVLEGTMELRLGQETHVLEAGSVAHIPAGTPHKHRNPGTERELHLEVIAPGMAIGRTFMEWAGDPSAWPPGGSVTHLRPEEWPESHPGTRGHFLSEPSGKFEAAFPDSRELMWFVLRSQPGVARGMGTHMHEFHQFYYVTEGTLGVDIGFEHHEAGPHTLVCIPPGAPHGNRAVGTGTETHLTINVPPPHWPSSPEQPWDVPVTLERRER
jgi:quercetin dioxygenase-like cupin family protein